MKRYTILFCFLFLIVPYIKGQGIISTIAGTGVAGYSGDGGLAITAQLNSPACIIKDDLGNLYFGDYNNFVIRKIEISSGIISTIAGNGTSGYSGDGGLATSAQLRSAYGLALDSMGNLYFSDYQSHVIRKVDAISGIISIIAGTGFLGYSGDGGLATSAQLSHPWSLAIDNVGNLYVAEQYNFRIRKIEANTGIINTIVGNGVGGYSGDGGLANAAEIQLPLALVLDLAGNIYFSQANASCVRKVSASTGIISTIAGTGIEGYSGDGGLAINAQLLNIYQIALDSLGNLYITQSDNTSVIRKIDVSTGVINTIAGTGFAGYNGEGGLATSTQLNNPTGVVIDNSGDIIIADFDNNRIRKITYSPVSSDDCNQQLGYTDLPKTINGIDVNYDNIGDVGFGLPTPFAPSCSPAIMVSPFFVQSGSGSYVITYTFSKKVNNVRLIVNSMSKGDSAFIRVNTNDLPLLSTNADDSCLHINGNLFCSLLTTRNGNTSGGVLNINYDGGYNSVSVFYEDSPDSELNSFLIALCEQSIQDDCGGLGRELPTYSTLLSNNDFHIKEGETFTLPITASGCDTCKVKFDYFLASFSGLPNQPVITGADSAIKTNTNIFTWKNNCGQTTALPVVPYASFIIKAFGNCPDGSNDAIVNVFVDKVAPQVNGTLTQMCPNATTTYNVSPTTGSTYTWAVTGGTLDVITGTNVSVQWGAAVGTYNISCTETNEFGCTGTTIKTMELIPPPTANAGSATTICINDSVAIGNPVIIPEYTYSWTSIPTGFTSTNPEPKVAPTITTTYIQVVTDINTTCTGSATVVVTISPPPAVFIFNASNKDTICLGGNLQLSGLNAQSYAWSDASNSTVVISNNPSIIVTPAITTTYIVEGTDAIGCKNTTTKTIVVRPLPILTPNITTLFTCPNIADTLSVTSNHSGNNTFLWYDLVTNTQIGTTASIVVSPTANTTYQAITTDNKGCTSAVNIPVTVYAAPVTSGIFAPTTSICPAYKGFVFTAKDTLNNSTYQWIVKGGSIATGQATNKSQIKINWNNQEDNTAYIKVIETSEDGCVGDTVTLPVVIEFTLHPPLPIGQDTLCSKNADSVLYAILPLAGSSYTWTVVGGTIKTTTGTGGCNAAIQWDNSAGIHQLSYKEDNGPCYGLSKVLNIVLNPSPSQNAMIGRDSVCSGETQSIYGINGLTGSTYKWSLGKATKATFSRNDSTVSAEISWPQTFLSAILDTVYVIETSKEGCVGDTVRMTVTINPPHQPDKIIGSDYVCIDPESGTTSVQQIYTALGGLQSSNYQWSLSGMGISIDSTRKDTAFISFSSFNASDKPTITVQEITKDSCSGQPISKTIRFDFAQPYMQYAGTRIKDYRIVQIAWDSSYNSLGSERSYYLYKRKLYSNEAWQSLGIQQNNNYIDTAVKTTLFAYQYLYKTLNICDDTTASKTQNTVLLKGAINEEQKTIHLNWNSYQNWLGGVAQYQVWRRLDSERDYTLYAQLEQNDTTINFTNGYDDFKHYYRVRAIQNSNTAVKESWSNELALTFEHPIFVPHVITPNGDGSNDVWKIAGIAAYKNASIEIYNRWGTQVYTHKGTYENDWGGTSSRKDLPDDTYFYVIKLNASNSEKGVKGELSGSVTILR